MATEEKLNWIMSSHTVEVAHPNDYNILAKIKIDPDQIRLSSTGKTFVAANCSHPLSIDGLPFMMTINVTRKPTIEEQATIDLAKLQAEERASKAARDAALVSASS